MVDEAVLEAGLRAGDERAFVLAVETWTPAMTRIARAFSGDPEVSTEIVRESWLSVVARLSVNEEHDGRRLRAVVFESVVERARAAARERGSAHVLATSDLGSGPTVDPARFRPAGDQYPGGWRAFPPVWPVEADVRQVVLGALDRLPGMQQVVVTLRDHQGCSADEVCRLLDLAPEQQRTLLHRGRAQLRQAIEDHLS